MQPPLGVLRRPSLQLPPLGGLCFKMLELRLLFSPVLTVWFSLLRLSLNEKLSSRCYNLIECLFPANWILQLGFLHNFTELIHKSIRILFRLKRKFHLQFCIFNSMELVKICYSTLIICLLLEAEFEQKTGSYIVWFAFRHFLAYFQVCILCFFGCARSNEFEF